MKRKSTSIQTRIFGTYSVFIFVIILIIVILSYSYIANALRKSAFQSLDDLTISLSKNIDQEIKKMDDITLNVLYSPLIKDSFHQYIEMQTIKVNDEITYLNEDERTTVRLLVDILVALQGPSLSIPQVMLHTYSGRSISTSSNNYYKTDLEEKKWFSGVNNKNGYMYITTPYQGTDLSMSTDDFTDEWLVSVCRTYFDKNNQPQGVVETKQYCFNLFSEISRFENNNLFTSVYVINENNNVIYPYVIDETQSNEGLFYYQYIKGNTSSQNGVITVREENVQKSLLSFYTSSYTGWTIILTTPERQVLSPLYLLIKNLFIASLLIIVFSVLLSYIFAGEISKPINKLRNIIHKYNINDEHSDLDLHSKISEIEELNKAFITMSHQLKDSINTLLTIQQQEMHSKMLALQSQMNPHFLYNTLSVIGAMAEENMDDEIVEMCANISDILRYISSDSSPLVPLEDELNITKKYLNCFTFRYSGKFFYDMHIPSNLKKVKIPKLSIQPLVENAIKYMGQVPPPWRISVKGWHSESGFRINVSDNGGGFSKEELERINKKMKLIDENNTLPSLKLDGMGILNIYIRLKLSYNDMAYFTLENTTAGASITFGADRLSNN